MELSLEIYSLIVAHMGSRGDICTLALVSKSFQAAAERALYNTLLMTDPAHTAMLCGLLARQPRVASLVVALTISTDEGSVASESDPSPLLPLGHWDLVHRALRRTSRLRYLSIYLDTGDGSNLSWILRDCTFQLQAFHCDLAWDADLVSFLSGQAGLSHLHVSDFDSNTPNNISLSSSSAPGTHVLPRLAMVECTFIDVVELLAPGRPLTHIKTCFSRTLPVEKHAELTTLVSSLKLSTTPIRSLNIPDSVYVASFSLDILSHLVNALRPNLRLEYLGPFVLPVDGRERLRLYGLFRQLPYLHCVELEVSAWDPPPVSVEAMRSLARELRLYGSAVSTVIFLADLEETIVRRTVSGNWIVDEDVNPDTLWHDV
ncbi:hypothetical protein K488DRAFT_57639 [Vararia minispora EC-137]|uniref:Uncharacterized protein n=1 Tax=Vararia minispora EC-137 TaxID=1314806 RepID=A0ACB8QB55_9AGAM|nr:hypothetical protein K488DRAFT_57639 [Vararia minispora EC-137]